MVGAIVLVVGDSCSLEQLISRCFGVYDLGQYGLNWLKNNFLGDILEERSINISFDRTLFKTKNENRYIQEKELEQYRYYHPYMYQRKMTNEFINLFDIGYDKKTNSLTFPVRNEMGNCLFVARRNVSYKQFSYPNNIEKPLYGLYEISLWTQKYDEVYICESMINAITCWVYGKYGLALNGTGTKNQIEQLKKLPCRKIVLALDPDEAGKKGSEKIKNALKPYKLVTQLQIPERKRY